MYGYEWTDEYGIYRLTIDAKLQKEIRPVFHEELDFFGMDAYWDYPKDTDAPLLWAEGIRRYILNGVCVAEAEGGSFYSKPVVKKLTEERLRLQPIDTRRLYTVNKTFMLSLEQKAITFIQQQHERFSKQGYAFVCAFSGGKDSLALLDLTARALAPKDFYVIFSNTGMELSDTLKAVEAAKQHYPQLRFEEAKCHMEPTESWDEFGPPGRRMRWCCTVHKSVPTLLALRDVLGEYNTKAVVLEGVRAEESARRSTYEDLANGVKNLSQINCRPILKWNTAELFCYLFKQNILFNNAYRKGLSRVGCKICPMHSAWSEGLIGSIYSSEIAELSQKIENFAINLKSPKEAHNYIDTGGWKARVSGRGIKGNIPRFTKQVYDNTLVFTFRKYKQDWLEVSKILGVTVQNDSKNSTLKTNNHYYQCTINHEKEALSVSYRPYDDMDKQTSVNLLGIAYKVAYCVGCKACMVECPMGAFVIQPNGKIAIRESICIHCGKCITFEERSCIAAKNLKLIEGVVVTMSSIDTTHAFGFRQAWLSHFLDTGADCFNQDVLGSRQYMSLKVWLKDAGLINVKRSGKINEIELSPLFEKIKPLGPYTPVVWAILWANTAYSSTIVHWFCLNVKAGSSFDKNDLVTLLGEEYSKRTRENAITALLETFRFSPIGSALQQGIPMDKAYLRAGWEMPHAVALLYAIYLYAEHMGRRAFTFSEMISAGNRAEVPGMSPADIFGIDVKAFREQVQGLAIAYPQYIRVSFVSNLDNIILESFSSLDVLDLANEPNE